MHIYFQAVIYTKKPMISQVTWNIWHLGIHLRAKSASFINLKKKTNLKSLLILLKTD